MSQVPADSAVRSEGDKVSHLLRRMIESLMAEPWQTSWKKRRVQRAYDKDARAAKTPEERRRIDDTCRFEISMIGEEADAAYSDRLQRTAERLHVPVPERDDANGYWTHYENSEFLRLTAKGSQELRKRIRAERRGQWETVTRWVSLFGAIAAFVAAVTGVVTVLRHR